MQVKVKGLEGAKQVSINTGAMEVKSNAIEILKNITRNLGTSFYDYVEDTATIVITSLLRDDLAYGTRKQSAKLMRFLIGACKDYPEKQKALFIMAYI